jgi:hypothetical protein
VPQRVGEKLVEEIVNRILICRLQITEKLFVYSSRFFSLVSSM